MALACELCSATPGEILTMSKVERDLVMSMAAQLENWRWKNWQKLLGG